MTDEEYEALKERVRAQGCCGNDSWRGRFCQYHQGFLDGYAEALDNPS